MVNKGVNGERKEEKRETNLSSVSWDAGLACFFSRNVRRSSQVMAQLPSQLMAQLQSKLWMGRAYGSMDKRDDHA